MSNAPSLADAVCGAYLLVTFADGRHDPVEENRLMATLANSEVTRSVGAMELEEAYNRLVAALDADYAGTSETILAAIRTFTDDAAVRAAVVSAARCAIVADQKVQPQEELVLARIADALGLDQGEI